MKSRRYQSTRAVPRQPTQAFLNKVWRLAAMVAAKQGYPFRLWRR